MNITCHQLDGKASTNQTKHEKQKQKEVIDLRTCGHPESRNSWKEPKPRRKEITSKNFPHGQISRMLILVWGAGRGNLLSLHPKTGEHQRKTTENKTRIQKN